MWSRLLYLFSVLILLIACQSFDSETIELDLFENESDSLFTQPDNRPYSLNENFEVKSDSLLLEQMPVKGEPDKLGKGDRIVVAEFMVQPTDTIDSLWVKVARDQYTQGWLREKDLLANTVPDNYISKFIDVFSNVHTIVFLVVIVLFSVLFLLRTLRKEKIKLHYFREVNSALSALLCLLVSFSALLYITLRTYYPGLWDFYYFNPSLNPFELPLLLGVLIGCIWLIVIVFIAVVDELLKQTSFIKTLYYLWGIISSCLLFYLFFVFIAKACTYLVYFFFILLFILFIIRLRSTHKYKYRCGNCKKKLREKGKCPHCGAING